MPPLLPDLLLSGFCFWLLLITSLVFVLAGFWSPRHWWLVMRKPPQITNLFALITLSAVLYFMSRELWDGEACSAGSCVDKFQRDKPDQSLIYWHLVGINFFIALFALWGALVNHARGRDEVAERAALDAQFAKATQHVEAIRAAWEASKGDASFVTLLAAQSLHCARDEAGMYVVINSAGELTPLDFGLLNETKTAIHDTLTGHLQNSGVVVLTVAEVRTQLARLTSEKAVAEDIKVAPNPPPPR